MKRIGMFLVMVVVMLFAVGQTVEAQTVVVPEMGMLPCVKASDRLFGFVMVDCVTSDGKRATFYLYPQGKDAFFVEWGIDPASSAAKTHHALRKDGVWYVGKLLRITPIEPVGVHFVIRGADGREMRSFIPRQPDSDSVTKSQYQPPVPALSSSCAKVDESSDFTAGFCAWIEGGDLRVKIQVTSYVLYWSTPEVNGEKEIYISLHVGHLQVTIRGAKHFGTPIYGKVIQLSPDLQLVFTEKVET